jgi:hypothetical protein
LSLTVFTLLLSSSNKFITLHVKSLPVGQVRRANAV